MSISDEKKINEKEEFETVEVEVIRFDTIADIICTSPIVGIQDLFRN